MEKKQTKPVPYDIKVIESGHVKELYYYGETRFRGYERSESYGANIGKVYVSDVDKETGELIQREATEAEAEAIKEAQKMSSREKSNVRARNNVRRLALSNFSNRSRFLTLTFRENIQDVELANKTFKRFIKYMNEDLRKEEKKLKYLAVIEFQKRGTIHYHMICEGIPFKKKGYRNHVRDRWRQAIRSVTGAEGEGVGNIDLKRLDTLKDVDNLGAYVVKYMTKADADKRLFGKKLYQTSRGLERPKEKTYRVESEAELEKLMKELGFDDKKIVFRSQYTDQFTLAPVNYFEVNPERRTQKSYE